jgi:cyclase
MYQRIIPSLLIKGNRLVKGIRFGSFRDAGNPRTTARAYSNQSADELLVLDISASKKQRMPDIEQIRLIADECFVPLTVGGGIRSVDDALACLDSGADKVCLNTAAIDNPTLIQELAHKLGSQAIVVSIDLVKKTDGSFGLYDHRCNKMVLAKDPLLWAAKCAEWGAGEIRIMNVEREGTLRGFDLEAYRSIRERVDIPIVVEGGAGELTDLEAAINLGVNGVAIGAMLVFSDANLVKIRQYLLSRSANVRPMG